MARQSRAKRPPEPLIYAPLQALDSDAIRALGKLSKQGNPKALSTTGDDSAIEGLSYLEDLEVVEEVVEAPLPFQETETVHEWGGQNENTSNLVNTQTMIQENKVTNIQEYPQTRLQENIETSIPVNLQTDIQPIEQPSNQEDKFTSNAVWPDSPIRGRRGSLQPLPGKIHWERRSNRTYRIDAETHDLVGDAATLVQRRVGYKLTRDDIAEWALRYAAQDILERGVMSDILRDLLSPDDGSLPFDDITGIQENQNTRKLANMNTRLPQVDSINHSALLTSLAERDESSRNRENKFTSIAVELPDPAELEQWNIFIQDFSREVPGDQAEQAVRAGTAHQLAQIRRRSGLAIEEFAEALYEALDRFRVEGNKAQQWAFFVDSLQLPVEE